MLNGWSGTICLGAAPVQSCAHSLCGCMLPSPFSPGQIRSRSLQCALLISGTLHVIPQLRKYCFEMWNLSVQEENRTFKCPQTVQGLEHVGGKAIPQINLFLWMPQGASSPLLRLPRWGWSDELVQTRRDHRNTCLVSTEKPFQSSFPQGTHPPRKAGSA